MSLLEIISTWRINFFLCRAFLYLTHSTQVNELFIIGRNNSKANMLYFGKMK